ncbi:hypothetical protein Achl_3994 (plasmid) [Pseudarthrobacter chlorophenolicus A6]|uniref:Uncharacterized protein n=1 Tax=Pseudarthrobacter chlorophenolicus (strain ATCC 700700 / DSM 12829 / CIP 107037 / JCM 12360 / KCTC 9906 / NCIMB 13794 / A6) TaxID=452863 RepID=B8HHP8_PSECP|nr:hypothetical protein [Pseudarthrobacter chlorophenolicus]ACL41945.1 hypothetical protein Achl_3994 [Pseudarthrobacter chlorophenolicus A6]SDQ19239.1 hypothetical protein SAMN04489738_0644 [Pseudarthrobacter chlorophenolicus]
MFIYMDLTRDLLKLETSFSRNFYNGDSLDAVRQQKSDGYFLLTAPHATNRWQDGRRKFADQYTGSVVQLLGTTAGQSWLATDGIASDWTYWDERNDAFKLALDSLLDEGKYLVNIVGVSARHGADLYVGLGSDPREEELEMAEMIEDTFGDFQVVAGGQFNALSPKSVRTYARSTGSGGIQLELAPSMRDPLAHPDTAGEFVLRFSELLATRSARCMDKELVA